MDLFVNRVWIYLPSLSLIQQIKYAATKLVAVTNLHVYVENKKGVNWCKYWHSWLIWHDALGDSIPSRVPKMNQRSSSTFPNLDFLWPKMPTSSQKKNLRYYSSIKAPFLIFIWDVVLLRLIVEKPVFDGCICQQKRWHHRQHKQVCTQRMAICLLALSLPDDSNNTYSRHKTTPVRPSILG